MGLDMYLFGIEQNDTIEQLTDVLKNGSYHKFFYMASW